jgi:hypothetical protein
MANPLVLQYQVLATSLDPLIQQLIANNQPVAAQQVGSAQGTLRAACVILIANDIDAILDPNDPEMARAIAAISGATAALQKGAAAIAQDIKRVTTIVAIASDAAQIASSLVPPNVSEIIAGASDTIKLLQ